MQPKLIWIWICYRQWSTGHRHNGLAYPLNFSGELLWPYVWVSVCLVQQPTLSCQVGSGIHVCSHFNSKILPLNIWRARHELRTRRREAAQSTCKNRNTFIMNVPQFPLLIYFKANEHSERERNELVYTLNMWWEFQIFFLSRSEQREVQFLFLKETHFPSSWLVYVNFSLSFLTFPRMFF